MTPKSNQWHRFEDLGVDSDEVFEALSIAVGGGSRPGERRATIGSPPVIEVGYSEKRNPLVRASKGAVEQDWPELARRVAELLQPAELWTTFTMSGRFRSTGTLVSESLQVRPVEEHPLALSAGPLTSDLDGEVGIPLNALLVDVHFKGCANGRLHARRRDRAIEQASGLLTLAAWPRLWRPQGNLEWAAAWSRDGSGQANIKVTPGFHHASIGDHPDRPSVAGLDRCQLLDVGTMQTGSLDHLNGPLYLLNSVGKVHTALANLPQQDRLRARRALAWYADATRANNVSTAISCYVAALESMLPQTGQEVCVKCGQPLFELNRRVKGFLDQYAGSAMRKEYRDAIYGLRSRLVHGAWHYRVDSPSFSITDVSYEDRLKVEGVVRAALLNWLLELTHIDK